MMWGDKNLYKGGDGKEEINIKDIIEEDMQNLDFACEDESGRKSGSYSLNKNILYLISLVDLAHD